ncbi:hypothetical protein ACFS32_25150 [Novosphingobium pokkalii]|uniref:hypothetical protein n=1 Tax=Novosphingobium pokkalii TaxID=1770194 RepID=UPI003629B2F0
MATPITASAGTSPAQWTRTGLAIVALCFAINMADGIDVTILSFIAPGFRQTGASAPIPWACCSAPAWSAWRSAAWASRRWPTGWGAAASSWPPLP